MLRPDDFDLIRRLVSTQFTAEPVNVEGLVRLLGLSQSLVSQRLRRLQKEGFLERFTIPTASGRVVHYRPLPAFSIQWVSPDEQVALQWQARGEVDWRFPLVSQVPDAPARQTLLALLNRLQERDLLFPTEVRGKATPIPHHGLSLIAYGSCARGTARPGSDLDLLSLQDEGKHTADVKERVESVCAEVSLAEPRPIQVKHLQADGVVDLPRGIKTSVQSEGLIVFDGLRTRPRGPRRRWWEFIYGGREHANVRASR